MRRQGDPDMEGRCVVYWMQRAQRGTDNPALDVAIDAANELQRPVAVFFGLHPKYPNANRRHYAFLIEGLAETARAIEQRGAAFIYRAYPDHDLLRFCAEVKPCLVIGDENPLRAPEVWRQSAALKLRVPFWTVDADVIVPSRLFPKEEYAARTLRPKIEKLLPVFLHPPDNPRAHWRWSAANRPQSHPLPSIDSLDDLPLDGHAGPVAAFKGGTDEGKRRLREFIHQRLAGYDTDRNLPHLASTSELSPYLHFGHLGPLTVALIVRQAAAPEKAKAAFLEELIVRRELAINYVARNPRYDHLEGSPAWAQRALAEHKRDERPHIYAEARLEAAETHDPLWNAAQLEMVVSGRMHGYLRMYWAKKILEWTRTPEDAFEIAMRLNDRYELDGRDPNGYTGIAWAIGGKHDRPWGPSRPVFGLVRYMSSQGCARKFDVKAYLERVNGLVSRSSGKQETQSAQARSAALSRRHD
jgi:deoxyribodipyrimidine photo-lyase